MNYYISLSAQLHRERYFPDSVVKCLAKLSVQERSSSLQSRQAMVPYDPSKLDEYAMCGSSYSGGASPVPDTDGAVVEVQSLSVRALGLYFTDTLKVAQTKDANGASSSSLVVIDDATDSLMLSPDSASSGRAEDAHLMFASPVVEPMGASRLRHLEQRCFAAACKLPPGLPPTFRGCCVRFYYGVHVTCVWSAGGKLQYTTLKVPIKLSSPISVVAIVRPPFASPTFDFCQECAAIPIGQSSPAIATPLSDALLVKDESWKRTLKPGGSELSGCGTSSYLTEALQQLQEDDSRPVDYQVRYGSTPVMNLILFSTSVSLGDSVRGVFVQSPNNEVVVARITASIESVERVPSEYLSKTKARTSSSESEVAEGGVVVNVVVADEQEWFTLNGAQIPFDFFLAPSKYTQTLQTHIVSLSWRIVFKFSSVPRSECSASKPSKKLAELYQELDVPLRIFAPAGVQNPRMGPLIVSPAPVVSS